MKIGILTFHRAHNYGAMLQAYALSEYLKNRGHQAEIIDYQPSSIVGVHKIIPWKRISKAGIKGKVKLILNVIFTYSKRKKRWNSFNSFINYLPLSEEKYEKNIKTTLAYDAIFFGSDQIWNPKITHGLDKTYTSQFPKGNCKFISYAASSEYSTFLYNFKNEYQDFLKNIDLISVREESIRDFLQPLTNKKIEIVLDPVFLLSYDSWKKIAILPKVNSNYLLVYTVANHPCVSDIANRIAKKQGLSIVWLTSDVYAFAKNTMKQTCTPQEFLGYFLSASYVLTTSFHGTAFSIISGVSFNNIQLGHSGDNRAFNLLKSIHYDL